LTEPAEIESGVEAMADDVWAWCTKASAFARTVTVKAKFANFHLVTRSQFLDNDREPRSPPPGKR
jgi:DNA polymerase IV